MFKKYFDKQKRQKIREKKIYDTGYLRAEENKNKEIKELRMKYELNLKLKDNLILKIEKRIQVIEEYVSKFDEVLCNTNSLIKKIRCNSYAKQMIASDEFKKIEGLDDMSDRLRIRFDFQKIKLEDKILEFKRKNVVNG